VTERVLVTAVLVVLAVAVATVVSRRRSAVPSGPRSGVPTQLDRAELEGQDAPWLVAVFTSSTCLACPEALSFAREVTSDQVVVTEIERSAHRRIHDRYGIEAVPLTVVADDQGVVVAAFVGGAAPAELSAAMATSGRSTNP